MDSRILPDGNWVLEAVTGEILLYRESSSTKEPTSNTGQIQVDFGPDSYFLPAENSRSANRPASKIRENVAKLVAFRR